MSDLARNAEWARSRQHRPYAPRVNEPKYVIGDISRREDEPAMTVECRKCDLPRPQQLMARAAKGGETWSVLPCTSCPLDLGGRR